jgi:hypothetical protein
MTITTTNYSLLCEVLNEKPRANGILKKITKPTFFNETFSDEELLRTR